MLYFLLFLFGISLGSFANVVVYRFNTGYGFWGRSRCFLCGKTLSFLELFPIVSFLFQKGRCRTCGAKISWQYPVVEFLAGCIFVLVGAFYFTGDIFSVTASSLYYYVLHVFIFVVLLVLSVYDIKHKIIPNRLVYLFIMLSVVSVLSPFFVFERVGLNSVSLLDLAAGPFFFFLFASLWFFSGGAWMGFGDAKLVLGIGILLGFAKGFFALLIAFWAGAIVGIVLLSLPRKSFTMKSEVPFAPFLCFGTFLAFLADVKLFLPYILLF